MGEDSIPLSSAGQAPPPDPPTEVPIPAIYRKTTTARDIEAKPRNSGRNRLEVLGLNPKP